MIVWRANMKDNEIVSIIITTHNNIKTIKRAIDSVIKGPRLPDHIVIGDNDSSDGTYELLCEMLGAKEIEVEDKRGLPPKFDGKLNDIPITIFRNRLNTNAYVLNICLAIAPKITTIFGFLNPDDWYNPDKIIRSLHEFQKNGAIACVVSDCDIYHNDGRIVRDFKYSFSNSRLMSSYLFDQNFFVRSIVFPRIGGGFDPNLKVREDYDLLIRASEIGLIYHIPEALHNSLPLINNSDEISKHEHLIRETALKRRNNNAQR